MLFINKKWEEESQIYVNLVVTLDLLSTCWIQNIYVALL